MHLDIECALRKFTSDGPLWRRCLRGLRLVVATRTPSAEVRASSPARPFLQAAWRAAPPCLAALSQVAQTRAREPASALAASGRTMRFPTTGAPSPAVGARAETHGSSRGLEPDASPARRIRPGMPRHEGGRPRICGQTDDAMGAPSRIYRARGPRGKPPAEGTAQCRPMADVPSTGD